MCELSCLLEITWIDIITLNTARNHSEDFQTIIIVAFSPIPKQKIKLPKMANDSECPDNLHMEW
jgi:hypothetical protein